MADARFYRYTIDVESVHIIFIHRRRIIRAKYNEPDDDDDDDDDERRLVYILFAAYANQGNDDRG